LTCPHEHSIIEAKSEAEAGAKILIYLLEKEPLTTSAKSDGQHADAAA
jgi:hypothetical protein